ncbi:MAG: hypothetical protein E6G34_12015 [Actinobacteria bacterium]|nr:MAG: hypothetical protein E6G34_12015 [Actinomycetota bacterium]
MPAKKLVKQPPHGPAAAEGNGSRPPTKSYASRAEAIDRLERLRSVVPVFAQELMSARRQAAQLRAENGSLVEQVRQLQRERALSNGSAPLPAGTSGR